jgi:twitching motility protein PilU
MKTFDSALFDLHQEGMITEEEALKNADSPNNVRLKIKFAGEGGTMEDDGSMGLSLESLDDDEDEEDNKFF